MYNLDFSVLKDSYGLILSGIATTIFVSVVSSAIAFLLGSIIVYFRISSSVGCRKFVGFIATFIRNTPLLIVIYLFYKGLPSIGIVFAPMLCGILALGIYSATYFADAILSGVRAVPKEHFQASRALGLSKFQTFIYVIYPQALRYSIFILGSQLMNLIKNSSLVSFITVVDIFYVVYKGISDSYRVYEYFILAVIVYSALSAFVLLITNILQKSFAIRGTEVRL